MPPRFLYGLIGFPLGHSWSADYFNTRFRAGGRQDAEYRLFPIQSIADFPGLLIDNPGLAGLNVTIPYKEQVIPFLSELDETARDVGAVNTIRIERTGQGIRTRGYNTDARGFLETLPPDLPTGPALVLGTGGASRAVQWALKQRSQPFSLVSRGKTGPGIRNYIDLSDNVISGFRLIINTTPLGMFPDVHSCPPIPYHVLTPDHFLYDLVYNPEESEFLKQGRAAGARTMNGLAMLHRQAELSAEIFP